MNRTARRDVPETGPHASAARGPDGSHLHGVRALR